MDFRAQKKQDREQLEAWARIYGTPPKESTAGVKKKETHRFEQWLEGQLQANRETLAQQGNFPLTEEYVKSDAEKRFENQSFTGGMGDVPGPSPNEAWVTSST